MSLQRSTVNLEGTDKHLGPTFGSVMEVHHTVFSVSFKIILNTTLVLTPKSIFGP